MNLLSLMTCSSLLLLNFPRSKHNDLNLVSQWMVLLAHLYPQHVVDPTIIAVILFLTRIIHQCQQIFHQIQKKHLFQAASLQSSLQKVFQQSKLPVSNEINPSNPFPVKSKNVTLQHPLHQLLQLHHYLQLQSQHTNTYSLPSRQMSALHLWEIP